MTEGQTNRLIYTCECGRTWKQEYLMELKGQTIFLSRFVPLSAPDECLCSCGSTAAVDLETPMVGYRWMRVRRLALAFDVPRYSDPIKNQQFEQLVQLLIEEEKPFQEEQLNGVEEKAHKILKVGLTADRWKALSAQQREAALKLQP